MSPGTDEPERPVRIRLARLPHGKGLPLPGLATPGAAAVDLAAALGLLEKLELAPGERALIPTGFAIEIPDGYEGQVRPRSGLALRHGIVVPNSPGTIDSDYRGELQVILLNAGGEPFTIARGDRIAQLLISPVLRVVWEEAASPAELSETKRGAGGFGHTGHSGGTSNP